MRKIFLLFLAIFVVGLTSCDKEDLLGKSATVNVTVMKNGTLKNGVTVYMFDSQSINTSSSFFKPNFSKSSSVTENGIATFSISGEEFFDEQETFYFAVFEGNKYWNTSTTIKKGDSKNLTINY